MRTLFVFILGIAIGAVAMHFYYRDPTVATRAPVAAGNATANASDAAQSAFAKTRGIASDLSDGLAAKMRDWNLTPDDIRADLARGGEVVRQNASRASEKVADVRIVAVIKAKFVLDRDLSATAVNVDCQNGDVLLTGTVRSEPLIGKAVAHALDTEGVRNVKSKLTAQP